MYAITMQSVGERAILRNPVGKGLAAGISNYYLGHCPLGVEQVPGYKEVWYEGIYPGIDLKIYSGSRGPKLSFICAPGSHPNDIALDFDGQDSLGIDVDGALRLFLDGKWIRLPQAVAYQLDSSMNVLPLSWMPVYDFGGSGLVGFEFDEYDEELPVIFQIGEPPMAAWEPIDPRNLGWSTYAGGNDYDEFLASDADEVGNVYTCGYAMDMNFPVGTGSQQFTADDGLFAGFQDAVAMKFEASTKRILWATYIGGTGFPGTWEQAADITVYKGTASNRQYAFIAGSTPSSDFPNFARPSTVFAGAVAEANTVLGKRLFAAAFRKFDGRRDWTTTHGAPTGESWTQDGTALHVDELGNLVVGGRLGPSTTGTYPFVTPTGA